MMTRSILIYANCQCEELQRTGRYLQSLSGFDFKCIPLHLLTQQDWETSYGPEFMADVSTVWEQVEAGPISGHRAELRQRIPQGCQVVTFPPLSALCLWPFSGSDPRLAADPTRYPWPDAIGAVLATEDLPDALLFEKYLNLTTQRMPDLDRRLRLDVTRWRATDAISDIKAADWVTQNLTTTRLFHASGHITAEPTRFLLRQLLTRTGLIGPRLAAAAIEEAELLLRYHQGQDFECVPIHPLVAERLHLRFFDPAARYRWHGHEWTFRQYILHYIRWADYLD
jgi:hypothetical protein